MRPTACAGGIHRRWRSSPIARSIFSLAAILLAGSVVLSACGGSSSATTKSTSTAASGGANPKASFAAFAACMQHHGVRFGGGFFGGGGFSAGGGFPSGGSFSAGQGFHSSAFQKAASACASLRPKGGFGGGQAKGFSSAGFSAYRNCLKIHGVTLPGRSSSASNSTPPGGFNPNSSAVKKAVAACASLKPGS